MLSTFCNSRVKSERNKKCYAKSSKIKTFINKLNREGIYYLSEKVDWKKIEKNNLTIAINVLYAKKEKIYPVYVSKHNSNQEKQVILWMIPHWEGRHYLAVKKLSALLRGITSKNNGDFYCLNFLHSFRTKKPRESHKKECENKDLFDIIMPSEHTKILEKNQHKKSDKAPFITSAALECLIEKLMGVNMFQSK